MSFPESIRQKALVAAARHCCVCRRFKGVGIEVHHIVAKGSGGPDAIENAIALCFDCHAAAGHYNPQHPRGIRFSPGELRKHRDIWHAIVASGKVAGQTVEGSILHIRHLLSLDNMATSDLLNLERSRIPFAVTYIQQNKVLEFMRRTLKDDLPVTPHASAHLVGHDWGRRYSTLALLHAADEKFQGRLKRALEESDFGQGGIRSKILRACYDEGLPLSEIGIAEVEVGGCGAGATIYFSLRRPLHVFSEISNISQTPVTVTGIWAHHDLQKLLNPRPLAEEVSEVTLVPITPVLLNPGENLIVPASVLLGPFEADDLRTDYSVYETMSDEQSQSLGLRMNVTELCESSLDFLRIGPSIDIQGFELLTHTGNVLVHAHRFRPDQCYLWHRAWHVGSCPHVYFQNANGVWSHFGEILRKGWRKAVTERIVVPRGACLMRIIEIEFETSILDSVTLDGVEQLSESCRLKRGDYIDLAVSPGADIEVRGLYDCAIQEPQYPAHIRQKRSLLAAFEMSSIY